MKLSTVLARMHPSPALVVAVLALSLSITSTAAAAAIVISSNSQVAAHTIAGAAAPSGDRQNLIPGSVGTKDLDAGAVTPGKLSDNARAHMIDFVRTGTTNSGWVTLVQLDELTLEARCVVVGYPMSLQLRLTSSVPGDVNYGYIEASDGNPPASSVAGGTGLAAGTPFGLATLYSGGPGNRFEGQFVYANGSRVISATFHEVAVQSLNYLCEVTGTAVQASAN